MVVPPIPWCTAPAKPRTMMDAIFPRYGLGHEVANSMTFGTYPNIEAGLIAAINSGKNLVGAGDGRSMGETYDAALSNAQGARREYRGEFPITATVGGMTGGMLTGAGLMKNGVSIVGNMANRGLSSLAPRIAGGAAGFGGGEGGFDQRLKNAQINLMLGAAVGATGRPNSMPQCRSCKALIKEHLTSQVPTCSVCGAMWPAGMTGVWIAAVASVGIIVCPRMLA